jgi:hypothetical protein
MRDLIGLYMTGQLDEFMSDVDPDLIISTIHDNDAGKAMSVVEQITPVLDDTVHGENNMAKISTDPSLSFGSFLPWLLAQDFAPADRVNEDAWRMDLGRVDHGDGLADFSNLIADFQESDGVKV